MFFLYLWLCHFVVDAHFDQHVPFSNDGKAAEPKDDDREAA